MSTSNQDFSFLSPLLKDDNRSVLSASETRQNRFSNTSVYTPLYPVNSKYMTTFMILNYMIGSGILNQPYVVMKSGFVGSYCGYIFATYLTWRCANMLTLCGIHVNKFDYSSVAMHAFGKTGEMWTDIAVSAATFGSLIGYILVIGTTLSDLLRAWGCSSDTCSDPAVIVAVGIFVTPLCLFRHFGHLVVLSIFSVASIWTVMFLVIIGGTYYQVPSNTVNVFSASGSLVSLGSIIGALSITTGNFQAYVSTEKAAQSSEEWKIVTGWAIAAGSSMCLGIGTGTYCYFSSYLL